MSQLDEPNVILPLAASYNTRGMDGLTNTITNALDQRKVNAIYVPVRNSMTGKTTLYIAKRPGATISATSFGTSGQVAYQVISKPNATDETQVWLFSVSGNDVRVHDGSSTTVIVTAAGYVPAYVQKTLISGVDTILLQIRNASNAQRYFYASVIGSWTEIIDTDLTGFTNVGKIECMDGYAFAMDQATRRIFNSNLNDLSTWGSSSYITKQIKVDHPKTLARFGKQLLAGGEACTEVFRNAGNATGSPLESVPSLMQEVGMLKGSENDVGGDYYALCDSRLFFFGHSPIAGRDLGVYAYNGERCERVSTPPIDAILNSTDGTTTRAFSIYAMAWRGHKAVAVALDPVTASTQRWLMFFPDWKEWFEWNSTVFLPRTNGTMYLGVGSNQHRLYSFTSQTDNWQDDGTNYTRTLQFEMPTRGNARNFMRWCGVKGTLERSACIETVSISDDDGQTWSTLGTIDRTAAKQHVYRGGSYRKRHMRFANASNHEGRLEAFLARVE